MVVVHPISMYDLDSLFMTTRYSLPLSEEKPHLVELTNELHEVVDWLHLGLYLGIAPNELYSIEEENRGKVKRCRHAMLMWWLQHGRNLTWNFVVDALQGIRMESLARRVAARYGMLYKARGMKITDREVKSISNVMPGTYT